MAPNLSIMVGDRVIVLSEGRVGDVMTVERCPWTGRTEYGVRIDGERRVDVWRAEQVRQCG